MRRRKEVTQHKVDIGERLSAAHRCIVGRIFIESLLSCPITLQYAAWCV